MPAFSPETDVDELKPVIEWMLPGLLGMLGGLVSYFYPPSTEMRFHFWLFVSKILLSFFVGKVAGEFIALDNTFRSGYIMLLGFFAYPVMGIAEVKLKAWVEKFSPGAQ